MWTNSSASSSLAKVSDPIIQRLETLSAVRDRALAEGRLAIRHSANAVRALHRGESAEAQALVEQAGSLLEKLLRDLEPFPSVRWAGYVQDAMKEYAEASITFAIVSRQPLPTPESLGIDDPPYLNGLAEAATELRRMTLDALRLGAFNQAERYLGHMGEIYDLLVTIDFPDGLTGGLRRSTDTLRAVLERTRGDVTLTGAQERLLRALEDAHPTLDKRSEAPNQGNVQTSGA